MDPIIQAALKTVRRQQQQPQHQQQTQPQHQQQTQAQQLQNDLERMGEIVSKHVAEMEKGHRYLALRVNGWVLKIIKIYVFFRPGYRQESRENMAWKGENLGCCSILMN